MELTEELPIDPQSLARVMASTRAQHPGDVVAQVGRWMPCTGAFKSRKGH